MLVFSVVSARSRLSHFELKFMKVLRVCASVSVFVFHTMLTYNIAVCSLPLRLKFAKYVFVLNLCCIVR